MDDLTIREFKNKMIHLMNSTPIPLEVKRLVLSEILTETTQLVNSDINNMIENLKKQEAEKLEAPAEIDPENSPE